MLIYESPDISPQSTREGITCHRCSVPVIVQEPEYVNDFCYCFFECKEIMLAFSGTEEREKDYYSLFFQKISGSDTFSFTIRNKNGDFDLLADDYGVYTEYEDGKSFGYLVDWTKVKNILGGGSYYLIIDSNSLGTPKCEQFGEFSLMDFDIEEANGTVKIEAYQNGNLEHGYDYRGLNVYQSIRIKGRLSNEEPQDTTKNYLDGDRIVKQIQERSHSQYTLSFYTNNYLLARNLFYNFMMSDKILISDYNLFNRRVYNKLRVSRVETSISENDDARLSSYEVIVEDSIKNVIKNPYISS